MRLSQDRFVFYARWHKPGEQAPRVYVPVLTDPSYAKAWLDFFLLGENYSQEDDLILFPSGITLRSYQWEDIRASISGGIILDSSHERLINRFKYGTWEEARVLPISPISKDNIARSPSQHRPSRPEGYITITELCATSGILPMHARAALRASGRIKPEYGWAFSPSEVTEIKNICGIR